MIAFTCPKCRQLLSADDRAQGKIARCARCGTQMAVPGPPAAAVIPQQRPAPVVVDAEVQASREPPGVPRVLQPIVKDVDASGFVPADTERPEHLPVPAEATVPSSYALTQSDAIAEAQAKRQQLRLLLYALGGVGAVVCGLVLIAVLASGGSGKALPKTSSGGGHSVFRFTGRAPVTSETRREEVEERAGQGPTKPVPQVDDGSSPGPATSRDGQGNEKGTRGQAPTQVDKSSGAGETPISPPPVQGKLPSRTPSAQDTPPNEPPPDPKSAVNQTADDEKALGEARTWVKQLDSSYSTEDRIRALEALGKLGPRVKDVAGRAVAQCMIGPQNSRKVGLKALDALERIDPIVAKECNAIVVIDKEHCLASIQALGRLGKDAKSALPILIHVARTLLETPLIGLQVPKPAELAAATIQALVAIAPEEKGLARRVVTWMETHDESVKLACVIGLRHLEQLSKEEKQYAVAGLTKQLKLAPSDKVRAGAAEALGEYGVDARVAVEALENAKGDRNEAVRQSARQALTKIRGD